jgi:hypothetical protein
VADETCSTCGHAWTDHKRDEGCWNGWEHDREGVVTVDGCHCFLAHATLSRRTPVAEPRYMETLDEAERRGD